MKFDLEIPLAELDRKYPIVAFDTETSGPYAIESEVIELGAVKWYEGKIVDKFSTLLKPSTELSPANIRIHGITNEMVKNAPKMNEKIVAFCDFINDSVLVAHHAPFDLGFIAIDIESNGLRFPNTVNLCSSLISRALLHTTNHKLQTLIKELNLVGGEAHRAFDDAYACLQVLFKSIEKLDSHLTLKRLLEIQTKDLSWKNYQVLSSNDIKLNSLVQAMRNKKTINIIYEGGQTKNKSRPIRPYGVVRNPDGDYISAECGLDFQRKRFYLKKIIEVELF
jgi:DNA polymerase-3 subunit epsilon